MNIKKTLFAASTALLCGASPTLAQVLDKIFEGEELEKVCVPAPDNPVYQIDMDELVCEALGQQLSCEADPGIIDSLKSVFVKKYQFQLKEIAEPTGTRFFRTERLPGCPGSGNLNPDQIVHSGCARVICTSLGAPPVGATEEEDEEAAAFPFGFLIRETPDQLGKPFSDANPAQFSLDRNFEAGDNSFSFTGTVGYPISGYTRSVKDRIAGEQLFNPYSIVPFAALRRTENTGPNGDDVTNISAGVSLNYAITSSELFGGTVHGFSLNGQGVTDEEADSLIADGSLVYTPVPPFFVFTSGLDLGGISMRLEPAARFEFGHVFDPGSKQELLATNSYLRAGGSLGVVFYPSSDPLLDFLDGFSASATYTYLYGFDGPVDEFHRFDAALAYAFPGKNYGIGLRYLNGHVPVSLETEESMRLEFTVKF